MDKRNFNHRALMVWKDRFDPYRRKVELMALADRCEVSLDSVYGWCAGRRNPHRLLIPAISDQTGIPVKVLENER